MKKIIVSCIVVLSGLGYAFAQTTQSHFRIRNDEFNLMGHERYKSLSFGGWNVYNAINGIWSIEHWDGGLNIWRPYPALNAGNYYLFIDDYSTAVGIGKKPNSARFTRLDVDGRVRSWGTLVTSDEKYKTNITTITNALDKIKKLRGVSYDFIYRYDVYQNTDSKQMEVSPVKAEICKLQKANIKEINERRIGFIAQEVEKVIPEAVGKDEEGIYSVEYDAILPLLVEALKEQQKIIEKLEERINQLEKR